MRTKVDWTVELMGCMDRGDDGAMLDCLANGADPNAEDRHGRPMLCLAARMGHKGMIEALLKAGARVDAADRHAMTPLAWAASLEHVDAVRVLIRAGAPLESTDDTGRTPFLAASSKRSVAILEELLAAGANPMTRDFSLNTAMMLCCAAMLKDEESLPVARWLVQFGALEAKNNWGQAALGTAARFGKRKCAWILLESGASVQACGGLASLLRKASEEDGFKGWLESVVMAREQAGEISEEVSFGQERASETKGPRI